MLAHLVYQDVDRASAWLAATFGSVERFRYGNPPAGAQMVLAGARIMLRAVRPGEATPPPAGVTTQSLTVFVENVDGQYARARTAGAKIVEELLSGKPRVDGGRL